MTRQTQRRWFGVCISIQSQVIEENSLVTGVEKVLAVNFFWILAVNFFWIFKPSDSEFLQKCLELGYLNSKLMLRWYGPFKENRYLSKHLYIMATEWTWRWDTHGTICFCLPCTTSSISLTTFTRSCTEKSKMSMQQHTIGTLLSLLSFVTRVIILIKWIVGMNVNPHTDGGGGVYAPTGF